MLFADVVQTIPVSDPSAMKAFFLAHSANWISLVIAPLNYIFLALLGFEVWRTAIDRAGRNPDLAELGWAFVTTSLHRGFWATMIIWGPTWLQDILDGFTQLGLRLGGSGFHVMTPSEVFADGLDIAVSLQAHSGITGILFDPLTSWSFLISAWLIALAYAILAAHFLKCSIETVIVMRAAFILIAFGGSRWTDAYAERYVTLVIACAIRLMVLVLFVGFGHSFQQQMWAPTALGAADNDSGVWVAMGLTGTVFLFVVVAWALPTMIAGILSGSPALSGKELVAALAPGVQAVIASATMATSVATAGAGAAGGLGSQALRLMGFGSGGGATGSSTSRPQPQPDSFRSTRPQPQP